jgi:exopolysaccharide biosynthesis polyprenyl glycosylphosphotransferase
VQELAGLAYLLQPVAAICLVSSGFPVILLPVHLLPLNGARGLRFMPPVTQSSTSPRVQTTPTLVDEALPAATPFKAAQIPAVWTALERLALSQRAPQIMRRHLFRSIVRFTVLMSGDAGALLLLRAVLRGIRDEQWLGAHTASVVNSLIPQGALPLVQLLPAVLLGLIVLDTYGASDRRRDSGRLMAGATLGLGLPFWAYLWSHFSPLAIPGFIILAVVISLSLVTERHFIDHVVRSLWPIGPGAARALLIGRPEDTLRALEHPALTDSREFALGGAFDPSDTALNGDKDGFSRLCHTIKQYRADTVVLTGPLNDEAFAVVMEAAGAAGCQLYALSRSFVLGGLEFQTMWRRGAPLVSLNRPALRGRQLMLKRALDLVVSTLGLVLLSPVFLGVAVVVRLSSSGPIFFRQTRVGLGGNPFKIIKFRSMVHDAEMRRDGLAPRSLYTDARLFKMKDDPRVTELGAFLRRTSLDELPQLWNVFRGHMSLVGPRPPLPSEVELYEYHHYTRFDVKPGITGPWQVSGRNSITDFEEVIRLETGYIRGWTIWKDLGILLRTVPVVLKMRGAH